MFDKNRSVCARCKDILTQFNFYYVLLAWSVDFSVDFKYRSV